MFCKKNGKTGIIVLIIVLLVLIASGIAAFFYFTGNEYNVGKNEKLAESCIASGDYKEAIDYYKEILNLDSSRKDIYIAAAEAYLELKNEDKAMEMLKEGLESCEDDSEAVTEIKAIMVKIYQKKIDASLADEDYEAAYSLITEGISTAGDESGTMVAKIADIYRLRSDEALAAGDCFLGLQILEKGKSVTGSTELSDRATYVKEHIEALPAKVYISNGSIVTREYDETGCLVKETSHTRDGELLGESAYEYDANGRVVKKTIQQQENEELSKSVFYYEYELDASGNVTKEHVVYEYPETPYVTNSSQYVNVYNYDGMGNVAWVETFKSDDGDDYDEDDLIEVKVYEYSSSGDLIMESYGEILEPGFYHRYWETEYDERGNVVRRFESAYKGDDLIGIFENKETLYEYDSLGNLNDIRTESKAVENDCVYWCSVQEYTCQFEGNRCQMISYSLVEEEENMTGVYSYDEAGRIISMELTYNEGFDTVLYSYSYDETEHAVYVNDKIFVDYYQPLQGNMKYEFNSNSLIEYSMWTYDSLGNKIYSVVGNHSVNGKEAVLSYVYRYTGE